MVKGLGLLLLQFAICLFDVALLPFLVPIGLICLVSSKRIDWLRKGLRHFVVNVAGKRFRASRFVLFIWYSLSYLVFFSLVISVSVLGVSPSSIESLEWVILVYWLSLILEEYMRIRNTPLRIYAREWSNGCDFLVILLFLFYFVLRFVGVYAGSLQSSRAASHVFGVAGFIACLSLLHYVQMYLLQSVGLVIISVGRVLPKMLNFIALLAMFLIAFGVWVTGIQRGSLYLAHERQTTSPSGETIANNTNVGTSIRLVFAVSRCLDGTIRNGCVTSFGSSTLLLFWSLFGQTSTDAFDVDTKVESIISTVIFAFWLVLTSIVLLNMLIGLVTDEYSSTKVISSYVEQSCSQT